MPESTSALLRRRLSPVESNVLLLASRGGAQAVLVELGGQLDLKSIEDAEARIAAVKSKASMIIANGGEESRTGREVRCDCGAEYVPRAGDRGKCPACRLLTGATEGGGARPKPAADKPAQRAVPVPELPPAKRKRGRPKAEPPKRRPRDAAPSNGNGAHSNGDGAHLPEEATRRLSLSELREVEQRGRDEQEAHRRDQQARLGDGPGAWPHTEGVVRRQLVVNEGDHAGRVKRKREGVPPRGPILGGRSAAEAALDAAGVDPAEREAIMGGGRSAPASSADDPPAGAEAVDEGFEEAAVSPAKGGMFAVADGRRERIVELLTDRPRSLKALRVLVGGSPHQISHDLDRLLLAERVERTEDYAYDWPGAPPEGERKGKPSRVWRLWTGNGAPPESQTSTAAAARAAEDPEPAEPEFDHDAEFDGPTQVEEDLERDGGCTTELVQTVEPLPARGDVLDGVPRDPVELHFAYTRLLFDIAKDAPGEQHVFDRIERLLQEGPPRGESRAS